MTNNEQQMGVDFFYNEVWACFSSNLSWSECERLKKIKDQAKEMEKAEKIKFATDFFFWWYNQTSGTNTYEAVEKFYEQTYGGKK